MVGEPLDEADVDADPLVQFGRWYDEAASVVTSPESMAIASSDLDGRPSVRMVLLKAFGPEGFSFFTNFESRKGRELSENPEAALLFHWEPLGRQVRIEGVVERVGDEQSDAYFASRPRESQLSAFGSRQSRPVEDRQTLETEVELLRERFADREVPRPPWWGGFRLVPRSYEFWQHRENRLHDRLLYTPDAAGWRLTRLQP
ncbi:MAG: pyridoxamine 5'-phosphate oxidase [Acidimicrobiales bacterium]